MKTGEKFAQKCKQSPVKGFEPDNFVWLFRPSPHQSKTKKPTNKMLVFSKDVHQSLKTALKLLPNLNFGILHAATFTGFLVRGLIFVVAALETSSKEPKPGI